MAHFSGDAWTVRAAVRGFRRRHPVGERVCVALSGGADSLALAAAAAAEFASVRAVVVDHGLQPGSTDVAKRAAEMAEGLGCRARVERVVVTGAGTGPEDAARRARYAALDRARDGLPVLLGHTLDDQAETVLLGLARGSGARSLAGMSPWKRPWGRPLLGVRAAQTRAACRELGLQPWEDPHNTDPAYTRVRVRREALPALEAALGGGVAEALARTAELLRADDEALTALAGQVELDSSGLDVGGLDVGALDVGAPDVEALDVAVVEPLAPAVRVRVLRRWLAGHGVDGLGSASLRAVDALVADWSGQGPVAVGGEAGDDGRTRRLVVVRRRGKLVVTADRHRPRDGAHDARDGFDL